MDSPHRPVVLVLAPAPLPWEVGTAPVRPGAGLLSLVGALLADLVDARGLLCPLPVARLCRALALLTAGETVVLLADDPMAPMDVEAWCGANGHFLVGVEERVGFWEFIVRAGAGGAGAIGGNQDPHAAV